MSGITFPENNPYFRNGFSLYINMYSEFFRENTILWTPRDMEGFFTNEDPYAYSKLYKDNVAEFAYKTGGVVNNILLANIIDSSTVIDKDKIDAINAMAAAVAEDEETAALLKKYMPQYETEQPTESGRFNGYVLDISAYTDCSLVNFSVGEYMLFDASGRVCRCYDLDTMDRLSNIDVITRIFGSDWQKKCVFESYNFDKKIPDDYDYLAKLAADPERVQLREVFYSDQGYSSVTYADDTEEYGVVYCRISLPY